MMSAFSMPESAMLRSKIYKDLFKNKKELHFIFEDYLIKKKGDEKKLEEYLIFKNEFFINLKSSLNKFEKKYLFLKKCLFNLKFYEMHYYRRSRIYRKQSCRKTY